MSAQSRSPVFTVGLTGGIASGKSAVSERFAALGVPVIDTDVIAREVVEPGQPVLREIIAAFGNEIVDEDGKLRRRKLREIIFSDPEKQALLQEIVHPAIRMETYRRVEQAKGSYCLVVIPLLAESGHFEWLDRVLVVDVPEEFQIQRLIARDGVREEDARRSLAAQASREVRLQLADDVIDNSADIRALDGAVAALHKKYESLARGGGAAPTRPS